MVEGEKDFHHSIRLPNEDKVIFKCTYGAKTHPKNMTKEHIEAFLTHLATHGHGAASTQRQALNAIVFLYDKALDLPIQDQIQALRARKQRRQPVVMTRDEVCASSNLPDPLLLFFPRDGSSEPARRTTPRTVPRFIWLFPSD